MKKFKVGQMVEIVGMEKCLVEENDYDIGDICEIAEVCGEDGSHDYGVYTTDKSDFWYFYEKELKEVEDESSF